MVTLTKTTEKPVDDVTIGDVVFLAGRGRIIHHGRRGSFVTVVATRGYRDRNGSHLVKDGPAQLRFVKLVGPQLVTA